MNSGSAFRSKAAQKQALKTYEQQLIRWQVPHETCLITTSFGPTHVILAGDPQAKPLVLLHGRGGNSGMWEHNMSFLTRHFRIYAVDIIGEAGKSAGTRPPYDSDAYARWLREVMDGLTCDSVSVCGLSVGALFAHQFALRFPESIDALILLAPPSLIKFRMSLLLRTFIANHLWPTSWRVRYFLKHMSSRAHDFSKQDIEELGILFRAYKRNNFRFPLISDEELAQLPQKTLILLGENEVVYDTQKAAERVRSVAPFITVNILPNAKHILHFDQPDLFHEKILEFTA